MFPCMTMALSSPAPSSIHAHHAGLTALSPDLGNVIAVVAFVYRRAGVVSADSVGRRAGKFPVAFADRGFVLLVDRNAASCPVLTLSDATNVRQTRDDSRSSAVPIPTKTSELFVVLSAPSKSNLLLSLRTPLYSAPRSRSTS